MTFPAKDSRSRLTGRARFEGAPATVAVRLFRPSVARVIASAPIRMRLQAQGAFGTTRSISISR